MPKKNKTRRITANDLPLDFNCNEVADALENLCRAKGFDYDLKVDIGFECAWGAELRITIKPNQEDTSDRSMVLLRAGGELPEVVVLEVYSDAMKDLAELGLITPEDIEPTFMKENLLPK